MAQTNGVVESMEQGDSMEEHSEDYKKLVEYGIDEKVAAALDKIYKSGVFQIIFIVMLCFVTITN